jgi:tetratricopeptide (TPR) repeat protein
MSLALVIATVVVYLPVCHHEFVNFDDAALVAENPNLRDGLTWRSVRWAFTAGLTHHDPNADYWRPLSFLSHALDIELFGLRPAGHHLINVGIHAAAAVALFLVLQSMIHAPWRCALVAALFALHPLRVESVAWVTERKDVLSGLFFILTLGAYTRYVRGPFSMTRYVAVFFVFALALMSKSMVVTLPFVLLLLDYWPLGRTRWVPPVVAGNNVTMPPGQLLKEKLPLFALAAASCVVTFLGQAGRGRMNFTSVSLGTRIANALLSYAGYIGKMFWPTGLAVWYPLEPGLSAATAMVAGIGLVGVTTAVIGGARRRPWLVTGWFWYLGMLVPVIGVFQGSGEAMADRFTYLPSIGLTVMLCWSVPARAVERRISKVTTCVVAAAVVAVCAALSRVQVGYWKDSETLFRHALDVTRDNWLTQNNLGSTLFQAGQVEEAIGHYEQALRIKPDYVEAHNNLATALERAGRLQDAIGHYEQALRIKPDFAEAHYNLGLALLQAGKVSEAIGQYKQALRIKPEYAEAHNNLATALERAGRLQDAIGHYEQALRINPDYATAHNNLGNALMRLGKVQDAVGHLEEAVRLTPDSVEGHNNLGSALEQAGKIREAVGQLEEALRIKPDYAEAQNNLAWLLATHAPAEGGDPMQAVSLAERACQLTGDRVAPYLDTLAAAYAAAGRFKDAVATAQKAIELAKSAGQTQVVSEIEPRLQLYRNGQAYRRAVAVTSPPKP